MSQACRCCNAQLTKSEHEAGSALCTYCDDHAHVLEAGKPGGRTSCGLPAPAADVAGPDVSRNAFHTPHAVRPWWDEPEFRNPGFGGWWYVGGRRA